jgi:F420-dependent oxidoreductase-like protein
MTFRTALMIEPQNGMSWEDLVTVARSAEDAGFETLFRSDHYSSFWDSDDRSTDAWTTLAGLAVITSTLRLGTFVSPVTFRTPGSLAKVVTTVDEMSGGRVELGVGTGWFAPEHHRHGFAFPPLGQRFDVLEDQLEVLARLWGPDGASYAGHGVRLEDTRFQPKPVQRPHPPIVIGGMAAPRSASLAARFADEYNLHDAPPAETRRRREVLRQACRDVGRDPASLTISFMAFTVIGRDAAEVRARAEQGRRWMTPGTSLEQILRRGDDDAWLVGTVNEVRARIQDYVDVGIERIVFQILIPEDLQMIELLGRQFGSVTTSAA